MGLGPTNLKLCQKLLLLVEIKKSQSLKILPLPFKWMFVALKVNGLFTHLQKQVWLSLCACTCAGIYPACSLTLSGPGFYILEFHQLLL